MCEVLNIRMVGMRFLFYPLGDGDGGYSLLTAAVTSLVCSLLALLVALTMRVHDLG